MNREQKGQARTVSAHSRRLLATRSLGGRLMIYVKWNHRWTSAMGRHGRSTALLTLFLLVSVACASQQRVDPLFRVTLANPPTYSSGGGPVVWIDEAHNNVAITAGRYGPFIEVLEADGFAVKFMRTGFTPDSLKDIELLVIASALHDRNLQNSSLLEAGRHATVPDPLVSAFSQQEIDAVNEWVAEGGALLLLAEHMPIGGAVAQLAQSFGFTMLNGFVEDPDTWDPIVFRRSDGTLVDHPITRGWGRDTGVEFVATFHGTAFRADGAEPLMILGPQHVLYQPEVAWEIDENTPTISVAGWFQGAVSNSYDGRIAVFGDATMFSAQFTGEGIPMGMNSDEGAHNLQFLLNVMHWLVGLNVDE